MKIESPATKYWRYKAEKVIKQRDNMLSELKIISESEICPAVLAQVAINAINDVKDSAMDELTSNAQKLGFYEVDCRKALEAAKCK